MIRKIMKPALFALSLLLAGCGGDNAYSGTGILGGTPTSSQVDALTSIQTTILQKHADALIESITTMQTTVDGYENNLTSSDVETLQSEFKSIMTEWKSVETSYIASEYNSSMIDIPQYMDYFQTGKSLDVAADVQSALDLSTDIEAALYKNSSKSITALEFLIFGNTAAVDELVVLMNKNDKRRLDAISVVLANMEAKSSLITAFYQNDTDFTADAADAANALVNALIDSAYKLKEWRIGEPAGISVSYQDDPDPSRLEYAKSRLSLEAMIAILETHDEIMGEHNETNFGSFASENGADTVVTEIRAQITASLALLAEFTVPMEDAITTTSIDPKIETLYATTKELQRLYYESLIQALDLTAEIIEADGD